MLTNFLVIAAVYEECWKKEQLFKQNTNAESFRGISGKLNEVRQSQSKIEMLDVTGYSPDTLLVSEWFIGIMCFSKSFMFHRKQSKDDMVLFWPVVVIVRCLLPEPTRDRLLSNDICERTGQKFYSVGMWIKQISVSPLRREHEPRVTLELNRFLQSHHITADSFFTYNHRFGRSIFYSFNLRFRICHGYTVLRWWELQLFFRVVKKKTAGNKYFKYSASERGFKFCKSACGIID